eukprot:CAMPEP_0172674322 /NCGR_PEP_ID=MMETSP1074-20121228/12673_1 /TAXON_ID=2916 /ORGANISM="Ceratium fusus, Strain PA161109" /LENGTH=112 /DNA_ID=CAMNT_0013491721 /DNA_START=180 /DNA_END=518 /DNA_ORIENTATION=+
MRGDNTCVPPGTHVSCEKGVQCTHSTGGAAVAGWLPACDYAALALPPTVPSEDIGSSRGVDGAVEHSERISAGVAFTGHPLHESSLAAVGRSFARRLQHPASCSFWYNHCRK